MLPKTQRYAFHILTISLTADISAYISLYKQCTITQLKKRYLSYSTFVCVRNDSRCRFQQISLTTIDDYCSCALVNICVFVVNSRVYICLQQRNVACFEGITSRLNIHKIQSIKKHVMQHHILSATQIYTNICVKYMCIFLYLVILISCIYTPLLAVI